VVSVLHGRLLVCGPAFMHNDALSTAARELAGEQ